MEIANENCIQLYKIIPKIPVKIMKTHIYMYDKEKRNGQISPSVLRNTILNILTLFCVPSTQL